MATMRPVEMYCCYDDHTWQDSHFFEIPADTPEDLIEEVAIARAKEVFTDPSIMFIGMHSLPSTDGWEAWKRHDGESPDDEEGEASGEASGDARRDSWEAVGGAAGGAGGRELAGASAVTAATERSVPRDEAGMLSASRAGMYAAPAALPATTPPGDATRASRRVQVQPRALALRLVLLLGVQFLVGMVTNLYVQIPATHPGSSADSYFSGVVQGLGWAITQGEWALQLHALLGLGVVIMGASLMAVAILRRERVWMICALVALVGMLGAAFAGTSFVNDGQNASSLLMSVGFLIALLSLIMGLYLTPRRPA